MTKRSQTQTYFMRTIRGDTMKSNINIFDQKAYVTDFRIPKKTRLPEFFYYDIRHSDISLGEPSTIEKRVIVNYFGVLVTTKELDFGDLDYIPLTDEQQQLIIDSLIGFEPPSAESPYIGSIANIVQLAAEYNIDQDKFVKFWQMRFPNHGPSYLENWARRLCNGTAKEQADNQTLQALEDSGLLD